MTGIARLVVSVCASAALALFVLAALPKQLDVTTDIVGYPTFGNFNIDRYYWTYAVVVVFAPLVALGVFLLLSRLTTGRFGPWGRAESAGTHVEEVPAVADWRLPAVAAGRTLLIGAVLGLEVAIAFEAGEGTALLVTLAYAAFVGLAAYAFTLGRGIYDVTRALNVLAAPLAVGGLYFVSSSTQVKVGEAVHEYAWLPAWLALSAVVVGYAAVVVLLRRIPRDALERAVVVFVVAPVGLFLLLSAVPGSLGAIEFYEEGQVLAGAELTRAGAFPWRDLLLAHGLLHDVVSGLFGFEAIEDSRWGVEAGKQLVLAPLAWVGVYYLCAYLFGANWLFLAGTQLLVVAGHLFAVEIRFLLLPFVLLLLAAVLRRASVVRVAAFATALGAQVIVTPEALPLAVAGVAAVVLYDAYGYRRGTRLVDAFRRTWLLLVSGAVLLALWSVFLASYGALDDWVFSYRAFVPGHRYTGGLPVEEGLLESFEAWGPIVALLAAFAFAAVFLRLRRPFVLDDWVVLGAASLTLLYYVKFVSRADAGHLAQVFAVATPFVLYAAYRLVVGLEAWLAGTVGSRVARWPSRHTVTLPILVVLLLTAPTSLVDVARSAASHQEVVAEREPEIERVGYDVADANDEELISDVGRAVSVLLEPGETIFDFSNTPALFHYLHDLPATTRYYHVGLALRLKTQTDLLEELERVQPAVVVYSSREIGLSGWDGVANQVRHYGVSQYLLDEFVPVLESHGFVVLERAGGSVPADPSLYFAVGACDWGYVPSFFSESPAPDAESLSLSVRELGATRWALTLPQDASAGGYRWLEITTSTPLQEARFDVSDRAAPTGSDLLVDGVRRAIAGGVLTPLAGARAISSTPTRRISFSTLGGETTVRVRVGSCAQWRGYRSGTLYLSSTAPQDISEVRLVR